MIDESEITRIYKSQKSSESPIINNQSGVYYDTGKDLWLAIRTSLLCQVDAIERHLGISPRTAELRKQSHGYRIIS